MAYNAGRLVPGICLYPAGRQPESSVPKSVSGVDADGAVAWGQLEFCSLGAFAVSFAGHGKERAGKFKSFAIYLGRLVPLFGQAGGTVFRGDFIKYGRAYWIPLAAAVICCTGMPRKVYEAKKYSFAATFGLILLFWGCVYCMYLGMDDPFLYYRF